MAWRKGATAEELVDQLNGISCQQQNKKDPELAEPCADGVAEAIKVVDSCAKPGKLVEGVKKEQCQAQERVNSKDRDNQIDSAAGRFES